GVPLAMKEVPVVLAVHAWVADWKSPLELCSRESPPWTRSYEVAPVSAVHASDAAPAPALFTVKSVEPGGTARRQLVPTLYGLGPADEKVIHPAFSDQARPLNNPVVGSILPPAPKGAKLIQPAFSDQAYPPSVPHPSFVTP